MRLALLVVVSLFCASCAKSHDIKPATLKFESIAPRPESVFFEVNFSSDVELLEIFWREKKANSFDQVFVCALAEDTDFSVEHTISKAAMGLVRENKDRVNKVGFGYTASISFKAIEDQNRSSKYLGREDLEALLKGKTRIPCKVVVTAAGYKAYYTKSLFIPVSDIFSVLSNWQHQ